MVHVCLVVPASEVRTVHSKQPCHWNVSRVPREQVGGNTALLPQLTPSGGLMGGPPKVCDFTSGVLDWRAPPDASCFRPSILALNSLHTHTYALHSNPCQRLRAHITHYIGCGTTPSSLFLSFLLSLMSCCIYMHIMCMCVFVWVTEGMCMWCV